MLGRHRGGVVVVARVCRYDAWFGLSRQRANCVREGIVRQPGHAVVVGPARIHSVTRAIAASHASRCPSAITLVVPDGKESSTGAHRKIGLPLRLSRIDIAVELEGGTESHPAIGGADVEDIPRVAVSGVARSIDVVNYAVEGSRLAPAHVPPVSGVAVHSTEVTRISTASADEAGAGVGVGPAIAAVGGAVDLVISIGSTAGSTATAAIFVHAGEVYIARDQVTRDLHIPNERSGNLLLIGPSVTIVSRIANEEIS